MDCLKILAFVLVVALPCAMAVTLPVTPLPNMAMSHRVVLDQQGKYVMLWTPREKDVVFEVQVATTGYVGLGFSPTGGMRNADIILGWVTDDNKVILHDRYATGNTVPEIDESQDVELLGGYQNASHTVLRFSRPWKTCDQEGDMEISSDTVRIIWAYGTSDPRDETSVSYHTQRGTKSLYLQEPQFTLPEFGDDVQTWDLFSPNVSLPSNLTTLYWCKLFKIPPLPRKTHVIGYMPVIQEGNMQNVHHILLYECHLPDSARYFEKWVGLNGSQCFGANMPLSWKFCSSPIVAWAIGSEGELFPEHVGFPLGEEHGGAAYFMMEVHYDNPKLKKGIVDSSGLRIFHTEKLRTYDAGIIMMGHTVSPMMMIPPNEEWLTIGHCSGDCTKKALPANGVKAFSSVLHSHLLGRNITVRHLRNNKELPVLSKDMNYDFNFQQARVFKEEVTILPGDSFITECGYDARQKSAPTFGGFGTQEEMCLAFIYYYPRGDLALCTSQPTDENLLSSLGIKDVYMAPVVGRKNGTTDVHGINEVEETKLADAMRSGTLNNLPKNVDLAQLLHFVIVRKPAEYQNQSLYNIVMSDKTWSNKDLVRQLQNTVVNGDHDPHCSLKSETREIQKNKTKISYPNFKPLPPPSAETCIEEETAAEVKPLVCPPQVPSCNVFRWTNTILGNRPSFF